MRVWVCDITGEKSEPVEGTHQTPEGWSSVRLSATIGYSGFSAVSANRDILLCPAETEKLRARLPDMTPQQSVEAKLLDLFRDFIYEECGQALSNMQISS